jgi:hypothetical protein
VLEADLLTALLVKLGAVRRQLSHERIPSSTLLCLEVTCEGESSTQEDAWLAA